MDAKYAEFVGVENLHAADHELFIFTKAVRVVSVSYSHFSSDLSRE